MSQFALKGPWFHWPANFSKKKLIGSAIVAAVVIGALAFAWWFAGTEGGFESLIGDAMTGSG